MKRIFAALVFLLFGTFAANAQGAPCQWSYAFVNGVATASYCGIVATSGAPASVTLQAFGAKCDSNGTSGNGTDDTVAIQAALNFSEQFGSKIRILGSEQVCRTTSTLIITGHVDLEGDSAPYSINYASDPVNTRGPGSWLYFDHAGKGIYITTESSTINPSGIVLDNFGILRNQPIPASNWFPNANDYDIYIEGGDGRIEHLLLWNPTKALYIGGRFLVSDIKGQPFQIGITTDGLTDVGRIDQIHFWPFWSTNANVISYQRANLIALNMARTDNPFVSNFFAINSEYCVRFFQGTRTGLTGSVTRGEFSNIGCDNVGIYGLYLDPDLTTTPSATFSNFYVLNISITGTHNIEMSGPNGGWISISNFRGSGAGNSAIDLQTTTAGANNLSIANSSIDTYSTVDSAAAFTVALGQRLWTSGYLLGIGSNAASGAGIFSSQPISSRIAPASSGCAINNQLGGTVGSFKANGACVAANLSLTLPASLNGWSCVAKDLTTPSDSLNQTGYSTTSATFLATMASGDLVSYNCAGF